MKNEIVFLLGSLTDSHIIRKVDYIVNCGFDVKVFGYVRDVNFSNKIEGISPVVLGTIYNEKYIRRVFNWMNAIKVIRSIEKDTIIYAWGYDLAFLCALFRKSFVYEISDIRYGSMAFPINTILKMIDRWTIRKSIKTVVTSEGFMDYLNVKKDSFILMQNKLPQSFLERKRPHVTISAQIRYGFVGLFRSPDTILGFARVIGQNYPNIEFHFWGTGSKIICNSIEELSTSYSNIFYHGPFKNPDDLDVIYENIDVVLCNYSTTRLNERILEPNKLYEAIYYQKPLIVTKGTFLANRVKELKCGIETDNSVDSYKQLIELLTPKYICEIAKYEANISTKELIEDYSEMVNELKYN